jgi:two-component system sensor histidine kinase BaeS
MQAVAVNAVKLGAPERRRAVLSILGALAAGIATQSLFWGARLGANLVVFDALYVAACLLLLRRGRVTAGAVAAGAGAIALGFAVAWYASEWALYVAFPADVVLLVALPFLVSRRIPAARTAALPGAMLDGLRAVPGAIASAARLPRAAIDEGGRKHVAHLARGLLLGLPVAAVFVVLLSADHNFSQAVERAVAGSGSATAMIVASIATGAALLVGYVLHTRPDAEPAAAATSAPTPYRLAGDVAVPAPQVRRLPRVKPLTWSVVLAQLVLVFAVFVATNVRSFFGGDALVHARGTPTYAQHLHAGFAQLSVATLLVVVAVVAGHRLLADERGGRALAALECALLVLAGVTLVSCFQRLLIYEDAYGCTYLRLGVGFFQLGVGGLLAITAIKAVARSWRGWASSAIALAFGLVVGAGCIDADGWVARTNVARAERGLPLDYEYLASLGPDAHRVLNDATVQKDWGGLEMLFESWDAKRAEAREGDWRSWRGLGLGKW